MLRRRDIVKTYPPEKDYDIAGSELSEGTYGEVYLATARQGGGHVAIKRFRNKSADIAEDVIQEIGSLVMLDHPNIIEVLGVHVTDGYIYMVTPYYNSSLENITQNYKARGEVIPRTNIKKWLQEILHALAYLHEKGYIHRDIKPQNIMITNDNQVKLIDFGLAKYVGVLGIPLESEVQTLWYRSPEVLRFNTYGYASDLWSVGCIMANLYEGRTIFTADSANALITKYEDIFGDLGAPENPQKIGRGISSIIKRVLEPPEWDLLGGLWQTNPGKRLTASQALGHPYFQGSSEPPKNSVTNTTNRESLERELQYFTVSPKMELIPQYSELISRSFGLISDTVLNAYYTFNYMVPFIQPTQYKVYLQASIYLAKKIYEVKFTELSDKEGIFAAIRHILAQCQFRVHVPVTSSLVRSYLSDANENELGNYLSLFTMFNGLWRYSMATLAKSIYHIVKFITTGQDLSNDPCIRDVLYTVEDMVIGDSCLADLGRKSYPNCMVRIKTIFTPDLAKKLETMKS